MQNWLRKRERVSPIEKPNPNSPPHLSLSELTPYGAAEQIFIRKWHRKNGLIHLLVFLNTK